MQAAKRWWGRALPLSFLLLLLALPVQAQVWRQALPQAHALGTGEMTWLGLRVYRATLWATQLPFDPRQAFALQLTYHMSIGRTRLARTSIDEIRRLNAGAIAPERLQRWQTQLEDILVDVSADDQLIGVFLPARGMQLYDGNRLLGQIDDVALARAFFDIWLNPDTRDPTLRGHLLGQ